MYTQYSNNLIISADDFGVSEKANRNILELAREKKIDRASVMMGGKISKKEAEELLESGVKIDIHLHLLEKEFFENRKKEAEKGIFKRTAVFLADFLIGAHSKAKVKIIWRKQIEDFHSLFGKYPDGINSHEHIHFFPPFFKAALKIKKEYGISYMRLGKLRYFQKFGKAAFILNKLRMMNFRRNLIFFTPLGIARSYPFELNTSDFLVSFDWVENEEEFFENILENTQAELVFHPERDNEYEFLMKNF
ncbi:MAG TPA: ChbG/HpnK family deacetylase [Candidatus Moranbacteria bacterium]|nr:ChbG/HpnK family deacetylase [Candidatus Moranbacteria bacterium]